MENFGEDAAGRWGETLKTWGKGKRRRRASLGRKKDEIRRRKKIPRGEEVQGAKNRKHQNYSKKTRSKVENRPAIRKLSLKGGPIFSTKKKAQGRPAIYQETVKGEASSKEKKPGMSRSITENPMRPKGKKNLSREAKGACHQSVGKWDGEALGRENREKGGREKRGVDAPDQKVHEVKKRRKGRKRASTKKNGFEKGKKGFSGVEKTLDASHKKLEWETVIE